MACDYSDTQNSETKSGGNRGMGQNQLKVPDAQPWHSVQVCNTRLLGWQKQCKGLNSSLQSNFDMASVLFKNIINTLCKHVFNIMLTEYYIFSLNVDTNIFDIIMNVADLVCSHNLDLNLNNDMTNYMQHPIACIHIICYHIFHI